jgi:hypothetical protein
MRLALIASLLASTALADVTVNGAVNIDGPPDGGSIKVATYSENDDGTHGISQYLSPETDLDYRLRTAGDMLLDHETFSYVAQNTGKHLYANTTMTATWSAGNLLTNATSITTTTTGLAFSTRAFFPVLGTSTLSFDAELAVSAATVPTNTVLDVGGGLVGAANPYLPTDGCWFRANAAGWQGVCSHNGTETSTGVFADFTPVVNQKYQLIVYIHQRAAEFWIGESVEDVHMHGLLEVPSGQGQVLMGQSAQFFVRHAIVGGAASGVFQAQLSAYSVRLGGPQFAREFGGGSGNSLYGSYQGMSGGTMGTLANYANSANPTAAVPTNTTAALGTGLGGQFWETDTLAVTTDGVISSYQVPAATVNAAGRRLRLQGVHIESYIQTALTGGGYVAQWSLAFGHTAVSLATAEAATTKAPRRVPLGVQAVASGAVASTALAVIDVTFGEAPIYVNPGEFVAIVKKKVGTAPSAGVVAHVIRLVYSWE